MRPGILDDCHHTYRELSKIVLATVPMYERYAYPVSGKFVKRQGAILTHGIKMCFYGKRVQFRCVRQGIILRDMVVASAMPTAMLSRALQFTRCFGSVEPTDSRGIVLPSTM